MDSLRGKITAQKESRPETGALWYQGEPHLPPFMPPNYGTVELLLTHLYQWCLETSWCGPEASSSSNVELVAREPDMALVCLA